MSDQHHNHNQDDSSASDDLSGLSGFFFYAFIVHPMTAWILKPGRFERKKSIMYAIAFLAMLAAIKTGLEMQQRGPNYYEILGISRTANPLEIKRAYKKLSLIYHPDKNNSPNAVTQFDEIKQAESILMDMELRSVYDKFGKDGIKNNKRFDEATFLIELAVYYVSYGMVVFMLTLGKRNGDARNWTFTGMIIMLILEVSIMTSQSNPLPIWLFPTMTVYEIVFLLHSLFPAFMNGCRCLGAYLYVDLDGQTRQLLFALQEQNKDILLVLRDVQIGVQTIQTHGVSGGGGASKSALLSTTAGANTTTAGTVVTTDGSQMMTRATATGKLRELQNRLQASNTNVAQAVQQLKASDSSSGKSSSSSFGFYMMILGYIVVSYIFSS